MRTCQQIIKETETAYSWDRYANWSAVIKKLMAYGLTDDETEAVVMSKWARWAADHEASRYSYGRFPARTLVDFVKRMGMNEVRKLTDEHFCR
jgi:hypothetical protein